MLRGALKVVAMALVWAAAMPTSAARADELNTQVEVVCRGNVALIRSIVAWNSDGPQYRRLPKGIDQGLSATRPKHRENCRLANGWPVRVRSGERQAFAYGMGGADPPAFYSLWVAHRKVLSRKEWKPGYGGEDPWLVAVVVRPDRLTFCEVKNGIDAPEQGGVTCRDQSFRLTKYKLDRIEYAPPGARPPVGTMLVLPGSPDAQLCHRYLRIDTIPDWEMRQASNSDTLLAAEGPQGGVHLRSAVVRLATGVRRKLVMWSGTNHYFDGDLVFLAPPEVSAADALKESMLDDADRFPTRGLPPGWTLISGGLPGLYPDIPWRYVHFDTRQLDGRLFLLAQPENWDQHPTAILVEPLPNGFRTVCRFQRVEPNF